MTGFVYKKIGQAGKMTSTMLVLPLLEISAEAGVSVNQRNRSANRTPRTFHEHWNIVNVETIMPLDTVNSRVPKAWRTDNSTSPTWLGEITLASCFTWASNAFALLSASGYSVGNDLICNGMDINALIASQYHVQHEWQMHIESRSMDFCAGLCRRR